MIIANHSIDLLEKRREFLLNNISERLETVATCERDLTDEKEGIERAKKYLSDCDSALEILRRSNEGPDDQDYLICQK